MYLYVRQPKTKQKCSFISAVEDEFHGDAGADVGGRCRGAHVRTSPTPEMAGQLSNTTRILQNKNYMHPLLRKILDPPLIRDHYKESVLFLWNTPLS